ncbi:MAG: lipocalin-like domain-containing protein [Bryobacterales bacterium]
MFEFPRDHFAHPEFQIEWWYYTGNLETADGRRFGYELTFFRNALEDAPLPRSPWDVDQVYLAHFTVSDIQAGAFHQSERLNRAGPGIAGASLEKRAIWNGNWRADWLDGGEQRLRAVSDGFAIEFELRTAKPPVVQGVNGVSQKADGLGKASHYVSFTRLETRGTVTVGGESFAVTGESWMDHEFSTDSMGEGQQGWDWMSIAWQDGTELMLYRMRREDGTADSHSAGTFIDKAGKARHLTSEDFEMTPSEWWTSERTGGRYPLAWTVRVKSLGLEFRMSTPLEKQEVVSRAGPSYWEGASDFEGTGPAGPVRGRGYVEMTGYDRPLQLGVAPKP